MNSFLFCEGQILQCSFFVIEKLITSLFKQDNREKERRSKSLCHKMDKDFKVEVECARKGGDEANQSFSMKAGSG